MAKDWTHKGEGLVKGERLVKGPTRNKDPMMAPYIDVSSPHNGIKGSKGAPKWAPLCPDTPFSRTFF